MERSRPKSTMVPSETASAQPRLVELDEVGESLLVRIELPGVKSSDLDVSISSGALIIRQEKAPPCRQNLPKLRDMREDVFFRAEYLYLRHLISLTGHNIRKACEMSGLSRSRLYTLLKKYQISSHCQIVNH